MNNNTFAQGEIWIIRLDPTEGSELKKTRTCLIISSSICNERLKTITVIPFTTGETHKRYTRINTIADKQNGLDKNSYLEISQIRTVSKKRCQKFIGIADKNIIKEIRNSFEFYFWDELN